jgi:endonuclease/exonuclease/phosphatase family metal-dependent hydrolase
VKYPTLDQIVSGRYAPRRSGSNGRIHLVSWNIERGLRLPQVIEFLRQESPDICLLQEVDLNARRTRRTNVAQTIASTLRLNYVYGTEFEELSQGSGSQKAYQGQAILSWGEFRDARVLRFRRQSEYWRSRWFLPNWTVFQARQGGRMALAAEVELGRTRVAVYNMHLESKGEDDLRMAQLTEVLQDTRRYRPDDPVLIAGDLNTRTSPCPLRQSLLACRFQDACAPLGCRATKPNGQRLDWIFGRGQVVFKGAKVHQDVTASDHFPLSADLMLRS